MDVSVLAPTPADVEELGEFVVVESHRCRGARRRRAVCHRRRVGQRHCRHRAYTVGTGFRCAKWNRTANHAGAEVEARAGVLPLPDVVVQLELGAVIPPPSKVEEADDVLLIPPAGEVDDEPPMLSSCSCCRKS